MQGFVGKGKELNPYSCVSHCGAQLFSSVWDMFAIDHGVQWGLREMSRAVCVLGYQLCELSLSLSSGNPLADHLWAQPRPGAIQQLFPSWEEAFSFNKKGVEIRRPPGQGG